MIYLGIFSVFIVVFVLLYNNLISKKNKLKEAYSGIDVMFKKRTDLIPQLVRTVKGYLKHERETLSEITRLRTKVLDTNMNDNQRIALENKLGALLGKLQIAVEAYPNLKASENFLQLQASLNEVEEQLSAARRSYNAAVNAFNNTIEMFPSNIVAILMGYRQKSMFAIHENEANPPKIEF